MWGPPDDEVAATLSDVDEEVVPQADLAKALLEKHPGDPAVHGMGLALQDTTTQAARAFLRTQEKEDDIAEIPLLHGRMGVKADSEGGAELQRTVLVTSHCIYEFEPHERVFSQLTAKYSLAEVHSVQLDHNLPRVIYLNLFGKTTAVKAKSTLSKFKRTFTNKSGKGQEPSAASFNDVVTRRTLLCADEYQRFQWHLVTSRVARNYWQRRFEMSVLPKSEHYRAHAFAMKWNKNRVLLVSNAWLYNLEVTFNPTELGVMKWAIPISNITELEVGGPQDTWLAINIDAKKAGDAAKTLKQHMGARTKPLNERHEWIFQSPGERNQQAKRLQAIFRDITGGTLPLRTKPAPQPDAVAPAKPTNAASVKEGFLEKVGADMSGWKRRYFVLLPNRLQYFRKVKDRKPAGEVQLCKDSEVEYLDRADSKGKQCTFSLVSRPGQRPYRINAFNEQERREWMRALHTAIQKL